jgi:hypothetical protein
MVLLAVSDFLHHWCCSRVLTTNMTKMRLNNQIPTLFFGSVIILTDSHSLIQLQSISSFCSHVVHSCHVIMMHVPVKEAAIDREKEDKPTCAKKK